MTHTSTLFDFAAELEREAHAAQEPQAPADVRPLSPAERLARRARDKERLQPVVLDLARRRGGEGIIASEVITEAITRGVFTGQESRMAPRAYSWVGPWLAQLARRGHLVEKRINGMRVRRKAERDASHANENLVYLHPEHAGASQVAA